MRQSVIGVAITAGAAALAPCLLLSCLMRTGFDVVDHRPDAVAADVIVVDGITPSLVASRSTGDAPLAVHFDATGASSTTPGVSDPAQGGTFRQIKHTFDFGDPGSGNHSISGLSRNTEPSGGGLAAHVFEVPGTYTVSVTSTDGVASASASVTITVSDPSALPTYAISKTGTFADAPAGATLLTQSTVPAFASHTRYFFNRGEDWSTADLLIEDPLTNVHIDAYGSGANPIFNRVAVGTERPVTTSFASDIRVSNITANAGFAQENGGQVLFYRCTTHATSSFGSFYTHVDPYGTLPQAAYTNSYEVFFVDCQLVGDGTLSSTSFGNGSRLVFLSSYFGGSSWDAISIGAWERGVMRHCRVESPYVNTSRPALGLISGGPNAYADNWLVSGGQNATTSSFVNWTTSKVVIANNTFGGGNGGAAVAMWTVAISPQNSAFGLQGAEPIEDVIVEGNKFIHAAAWVDGYLDIAASGRRVTSRNNSVVQGNGALVVGTGASQPAAYDGPYFTD